MKPHRCGEHSPLRDKFGPVIRDGTSTRTTGKVVSVVTFSYLLGIRCHRASPPSFDIHHNPS